MPKIIGIDYGTKRVGIAISDELGMLAREVGIWQKDNFFTELEKFLEDNPEVEEIIIGLPLNMSGEDSAKTVEVREFASEVGKQTELPTVLVDERLSSAMASQLPGGKNNIDSIAAQIILQNYLDQQKHKSNE